MTQFTQAIYAALRVPAWRSLRRQYTPHWEFPYDVVYAGNIRRTESSCMTQFSQGIYWHRTGRSASCMVLDKALLFQRVPVWRSWRSLRREYTLHWWMHHAWFLIRHHCSKGFLYDAVYAGNNYTPHWPIMYHAFYFYFYKALLFQRVPVWRILRREYKQ